MFYISPTTKIFVCSRSVDFRKGIDGLAAVCRNKLDQDPHSGALFVFCNRKRSSIRLLVYDGQGFWLCSKRLSRGKFHWWPEGPTMNARQILTLLWNGNPEPAKFSTDWKKV